MAATALTERYSANLHGALSCYDRLIVLLVWFRLCRLCRLRDVAANGNS